MAATTINLKSNVFLTLDDLKEWLRIPADACAKDVGLDNRLSRMLNQVTDMAERHLGGPIKTRSYVEYRDGDSSNTIVPQYYPIREVTEVRVDFNRAFPDTSIVKPGNYILRGPADPTFPTQLRGTDVVLRDDNDTSITGRIFTGSTVGSIKLSYTAGWGADQNEIPSDLTSAILMGVQFYYNMSESRDINVRSKAVNGQSISRIQGLPREVTDILDTYIDYSLGFNNRPQTNTFSL